MRAHILITATLLFGGFGTAFAQECLHSNLETVDDRLRREQAIQFARRLNAAQQMAPPVAPGRRYRSPDELLNLPPVPSGFQLQFNSDGRTYTLSLKDLRDPCRFAIFTDQEDHVYAATPLQSSAIIVPLGTK
jgi:hypothetical protein